LTRKYLSSHRRLLEHSKGKNLSNTYFGEKFKYTEIRKNNKNYNRGETSHIKAHHHHNSRLLKRNSKHKQSRG
jgi:cobyrinic acid a,c-diamide synthase